MSFEYKFDEHVMKGLRDSLNGDDFDNILIHGYQKNASDIFFKTFDFVRSDIYGRKYLLTDRKVTNAELNRFIMKAYGSETGISLLNSGEPINDVYVLKFYPDEDSSRIKTLRFRINITGASAANSLGYEITARHIPEYPPELDKTDVPQEVIDAFNYPNGLNLIIGSTGSGKSTLIAGLILNIIRDMSISKRIISLEAPIEFSFDNVKQKSSFITQIEVPKMIDTFWQGIEETLRKKPDHIFIGEMRDPQTITNAILASQQGHLVYSTIHVNSVAETIKRIANIYPGDEKRTKVADIIASSRLMLAQRLRPTLDGKRVAIREYLLFNNDIRHHLNAQDLDKISYHLEDMVWKYGVPFAVHARQRFLEGKISEQTYQEFLVGYSVTNAMLDNKIKELKEQGNIMFQNNDL